MTEPFPFQDEDERRIHHMAGGRCVVAWSMGLGKSFLALMRMKRRLGKGASVVVVCPAVAKGVWRAEARKHLGVRAEVLYHLKPDRRLRRGVLYVINYDVLGLPRRPGEGGPRNWTDRLLELNPDMVVVDEGHSCRNPRSRRSRAVRSLCRRANSVLVLTGTPLVNRPADLWSLLNMVRPDLYPAPLPFYRAYCEPRRNALGIMEYKGAANLPQLHRRLLRRHLMVRRRKEEVLKDLPPRHDRTVPLELPPAGQASYRHAEASVAAWLARQQAAARKRGFQVKVKSKLTALRVALVGLKRQAVQDWVEEFLAETDRKLVLFATHRCLLRPLYKKFKKFAVLVDGTVRDRDRELACEKFNRDPRCRLFLGNSEAAGVAWSCTSADDVAFAETPWNPAACEQAVARCHGQGRGTGKRALTVHWLVTPDTVDEAVLRVNARKKRVADAAVDGGPAGGVDLGSVLSALTDYVAARGGRAARSRKAEP